jgi:phenylpropionate dioxygenase-like ring-hydroxylating dioxygenase large terminal subunit
MNALPETRAAAPRNFKEQTLPGWCYNNAEFHELERQELLLGTWILACHVNEVKAAGGYHAIEAFGERAVVIRDTDGSLRAFYNVCRHRAHALVTGETGSCKAALRCPYHGWTYGFDGRLKAVPSEKSFPEMERGEYGLKPIELEVYLGFVFVRFRGGGAGVAERFAPYHQEMQAYRTEEMESLGTAWHSEIPVNWKNLIDNQLEGYHVPVGHPGLYRLFGSNYFAEAKPSMVTRQIGLIAERPSSNWSERMYQSVLPPIPHLTPERQRAWTYYNLLPSLAFDFYPECIGTFEVLPLGPTKTLLRGRIYALPNMTRELKAARWLNRRINTDVQTEDEVLVASVQSGLASGSYSFGLLSEKEVGLRHLHDLVRQALPVTTLDQAPAAGSIAAVNAQLRAKRSAA